ncbi:MAG: hypothetical protein ACI9QL_001423 [Candidatus Omnitrophota bacterium]
MVIPPDPGSDSTLDTFPPEADRVSSLAELAVGGIAGTWSLFVRDNFADDGGSITSWSLKFETLPGPMTAPRTQHSATRLPSGKVLVTGGSNQASGILNSTDLYDPATGTWSAAAPMAIARTRHTATLLTNGKVLVTGGSNGSGLTQAEIYNPESNTWASTGSMLTAREKHSAVRLPSGLVLVTADRFSAQATA